MPPTTPFASAGACDLSAIPAAERDAHVQRARTLFTDCTLVHPGGRGG